MKHLKRYFNGLFTLVMCAGVVGLGMMLYDVAAKIPHIFAVIVGISLFAYAIGFASEDSRDEEHKAINRFWRNR